MGLVTAVAFVLLLKQDVKLDWSTLPAYEKKITVSKRMATLPEIMAEVEKAVGAKTICSPAAVNIKATVLVKDMPARELLERLADTFDLDLKPTDRGLLMYETVLMQKWQREHLGAEVRYRKELAYNRIVALAAMRSTVLGPEPEPVSKEDMARIDSDAKVRNQWAKNAIRTPEGYAAAMIRINLPSKESFWAKLDFGGTAWRFDEPSQAPRDPSYGFIGTDPFDATRAPLDEFSAQYQGWQFILGYNEATGAWKLKTLIGERKAKLEEDSPLVRLPELPSALRSTSYAVHVLKWPKPELPEEYAKMKGKEEAEETDPVSYSTPGYTISDHLTWLHDHTGVNVIAQAFRVESEMKNLPRAGDSVKKVLNDLRKLDHCYLRCDPNCIELRPASFWLLRDLEPPEAAVRRLEKADLGGKGTLDDYGDFACQLTELQKERFMGKDRFMAAFDLEPLRRGVWPLGAYGSFSSAERKSLWSGRVYDSLIGRRYDQRVVGAAANACFGDIEVRGLMEQRLEDYGPFYGDMPGRRFRAKAFMERKARAVDARDPREVPNVPEAFGAGPLGRFFSLALPNGPTGIVGIRFSVTPTEGFTYWFHHGES